MITRQGERLIKKNFFIEKEDYERLVKYSKLKNQSVSQSIRDLMTMSQNWIENKTKEIEYKNSTQGPEENKETKQWTNQFE